MSNPTPNRSTISSVAEVSESLTKYAPKYSAQTQSSKAKRDEKKSSKQSNKQGDKKQEQQPQKVQKPDKTVNKPPEENNEMTFIWKNMKPKFKDLIQLGTQKYKDLFSANVNAQKVEGYQAGKFSQFASRIQQQLMARNNFINKTIKQAVISYQLKLKENYQQLQKFLKLDQVNNESPFVTHQQVKQFFKNPIQYYLKRYRMYQWDNFVQVHANKKKYIYKSALIDGKLVQATKLKLNDRFYHNGNLYLSTQVKDLYIKLEAEKKPIKVFFKKGKFLEQKQFFVDSEAVRQEIYGMVILYLKSKDILLEQDEVKHLKKQIITEVSKNPQNGQTN